MLYISLMNEVLRIMPRPGVNFGWMCRKKSLKVMATYFGDFAMLPMCVTPSDKNILTNPLVSNSNELG